MKADEISSYLMAMRFDVINVLDPFHYHYDFINSQKNQLNLFAAAAQNH